MREFGSEFDEVLLPDHYFEYLPEECKIYEIPLSISKRILCVPIDQRYNYWDIEDMINIIKSVINE